MSESKIWRPNSSIKNLFKRATILKKIRNFFFNRKILEVETPIMSQTSVTDVHLVPFQTKFVSEGFFSEKKLWLITSPEYHMKRLLAAGIGPIYQITHSFRNGEIGRFHNPEFTMLEWYRPNYDMFSLMDEVDSLFRLILKSGKSDFFSYRKVFIRYLEFDPLLISTLELRNIVKNINKGEVSSLKNEDRDTLLSLLFMLRIAPYIGSDKPIFVYNFPASQAGLARINSEDKRISERFEVYYKGIELANGCNELIDSVEQKKRFESDNYRRLCLGFPQYSIDSFLLNALKEDSMPSCSGVAVGVDRLIMLALNAKSIGEVVSFLFDRA